MRKFFLSMATLASLALTASAAGPGVPGQGPQPPPPPPGNPERVMPPRPLPPPSYPWTFINLQFFPGIPTDAECTQTNGVKVGAPITTGKAPVFGVEGSVLWAGTEEVNGLQCSLIACDAKEVTGIQFSLVNMSVTVCGLQLGIVNYASDKTFQIGLLNFVEDGPVFCLPILNFNL